MSYRKGVFLTFLWIKDIFLAFLWGEGCSCGPASSALWVFPLKRSDKTMKEEWDKAALLFIRLKLCWTGADHRLYFPSRLARACFSCRYHELAWNVELKTVSSWPGRAHLFDPRGAGVGTGRLDHNPRDSLQGWKKKRALNTKHINKNWRIEY